MKKRQSMGTLVATAAMIMSVLLSMSMLAAASPEKLDKFGCHKCTADCDKYGLVKNEFHCHGVVSVQSQNIQIAPRILNETLYRRVASVLDGDTLLVYLGTGGKKEKIGLLGVNAPERSPIEKAECYSVQATYKLDKLASNMFVRLEKDKLQQEDKDKSGRLLRYAALFNNTSLNEELLKGGYAKATAVLTTKVQEYKKLENEAKAKKLGMWGACFNAPKNETLSRLFPLKGERYGSKNLN